MKTLPLLLLTLPLVAADTPYLYNYPFYTQQQRPREEGARRNEW